MWELYVKADPILFESRSLELSAVRAQLVG